MKQSKKEQFRRELTKFIENYETKPNFITAVRDIQGLTEWYQTLYRQNLTEEVIDAMARDYDNQTISECRIYVTTNPNYKE